MSTDTSVHTGAIHYCCSCLVSQTAMAIQVQGVTMAEAEQADIIGLGGGEDEVVILGQQRRILSCQCIQIDIAAVTRRKRT